MNTQRRVTVPPKPPLDVVEDNYEDVGIAGTDGYPAQVIVKGAVYTQELPATHSSDGNVSVTTSVVDPLFNADPRRKEITFWVEDQSIYFGTDKGRVQSGMSAHLLAGGSATIKHKDALYFRGDSGTARISYIVELYGD